MSIRDVVQGLLADELDAACGDSSFSISTASELGSRTFWQRFNIIVVVEGVAKAEVLVLSPGARQLTGNARKTKKEEQKLDSQEQSRK